MYRLAFGDYSSSKAAITKRGTGVLGLAIIEKNSVIIRRLHSGLNAPRISHKRALGINSSFVREARRRLRERCTASLANIRRRIMHNPRSI